MFGSVNIKLAKNCNHSSKTQRNVSVPVDINGLQQAKGHPGPQEEHVVTKDHDSDEETSTQDDGLSRVSVFCLHAERSLGDSRETLLNTRVQCLEQKHELMSN